MTNDDVKLLRLVSPWSAKKFDDAAAAGNFEHTFNPDEAERAWTLAFALIAGGHERSLTTALPRAAREIANLARLFAGVGLHFQHEGVLAGPRSSPTGPIECVVTWKDDKMALEFTPDGRLTLFTKTTAPD